MAVLYLPKDELDQALGVPLECGCNRCVCMQCINSCQECEEKKCAGVYTAYVISCEIFKKRQVENDT